MWARGEGAWGMGRSGERWLRREEKKGKEDQAAQGRMRGRGDKGEGG